MRMTIGDRVIEAKIQKRAEAREEYEKAKQAGRTASAGWKILIFAGGSAVFSEKPMAATRTNLRRAMDFVEGFGYGRLFKPRTFSGRAIVTGSLDKGLIQRRFPTPPGGGELVINYPFVFKSSG